MLRACSLLRRRVIKVIWVRCPQMSPKKRPTVGRNASTPLSNNRWFRGISRRIHTKRPIMTIINGGKEILKGLRHRN
jgi:hypothetical protein